MKHADPLHKITIIPRGRALGVTFSLPEKDVYTMSAEQVKDKISILMGGRAAEVMMFGQKNTGASNDIERATEIARNMVTKWGLSEKLGPLTYSEDDGEIFLGRSVTRHKQVSDVTAHAIDEEVRGLVDDCYVEAKAILERETEKLHLMAEALIKYETIDEDQIKQIMNGQEPSPPEDWDDSEPGEGETVEVKPSEEKGTPPLGGPAGQH